MCYYILGTEYISDTSSQMTYLFKAVADIVVSNSPIFGAAWLFQDGVLPSPYVNSDGKNVYQNTLP